MCAGISEMPYDAIDSGDVGEVSVEPMAGVGCAFSAPSLFVRIYV